MLLQEKLRRVQAIPGVEAAGISDKLPLDRNRSWELSAKGRSYPADANHDAYVWYHLAAGQGCHYRCTQFLLDGIE